MLLCRLTPVGLGSSLCDSAQGWEVKGGAFGAVKGTKLSVLSHHWRKTVWVSPISTKEPYGCKVPFLIQDNPYHTPAVFVAKIAWLILILIQKCEGPGTARTILEKESTLADSCIPISRPTRSYGSRDGVVCTGGRAGTGRPEVIACVYNPRLLARQPGDSVGRKRALQPQVLSQRSVRTRNNEAGPLPHTIRRR